MRGIADPMSRGRQPRQGEYAHGTPAQTDHVCLAGPGSTRIETNSESWEDAMTAQKENLFLNSFTDPGPKGPKSGKSGRMWLMQQQLNDMRKAAAVEASRAGRRAGERNVDSLSSSVDQLSPSVDRSSVSQYERGWLRTPSPEYRGWLSQTGNLANLFPQSPALLVPSDGAPPMVGSNSQPQYVGGYYPAYPQPYPGTSATALGSGLFAGASLPGLEPHLSNAPHIFDNDETQEVEGLASVLEAARLPQSARDGIESEIKELGAIDVRELTRCDWEGLRCWKMLKVMEQRRVLAQIC